MTDRQILLKRLLKQRHWQTYGTFCREYDKAAVKVDPSLRGGWPSRAQLHRWLAGELKGLPYSDHCCVLEAMFPGRSAYELFSADGAEVSRLVGGSESHRGAGQAMCIAPQMADVSAVFSSRAAFSSAYPASMLFDRAHDIRAAGLSLNVICQGYPDHQLKRLLDAGTRIRCLFLDPHGDAIQAREAEEGYEDRTLTTLTTLNISMLTRLRARLAAESAQRLELRVYDETIRFNLLIVDRGLCVVQPYLPEARGVDSPTLVITENTASDGLFPVFDQVFTSIWERSRPV
ncbi:DUF5919 domain-containing protein [Nonomuraea glycinis]|uniref:DUF5919 domain-containing protein n=1 Tax=Nonomuraea glycinis TaxID=2047744 RepID=UPI002E11757E|nr:DUF5919 domain-containing protein [Nonomuraea glycinis]